MARAIKHIKAGPLHLEVIGAVPEGGPRKGRAGRSRPTCSAQQFYNDKCSWRELELMLAANFTGRDLVLTLTYDTGHLPEDKREAGESLQKFFRRFRTARRRRGEELRYIYNVEGFHGKAEDEYFGGDGSLEDRRLHHHVVLNSCGPGDLEEIRSLWPYGGYLRAEPLDLHYVRELAKYLTKEAREFGRGKPGERTWRGSRNLTKYEVEYIEIPSDSVTLTPPAGAVDVESFREKNPYGFADCVGQRYLLFEAAGNPGYSYTAGRGGLAARPDSH